MIMQEKTLKYAERYNVESKQLAEAMKKPTALEMFAHAVGETVKEQVRFKNALEWLELECCDLRCINVPTGGDDYEVEWLVISHHQAEPQEREVGRGRTPLLAIEAARGV